MTPQRLAKLLEPGLRKVFFDAYKERAPQYESIVGVESSKKAAEHFHRIAGLTEWQPFDGAVAYEEYVPGQDWSIRHTTYAKGLRIPYETAEDDLYGIVGPRGEGIGGRRAKQLGRGARIAAEKLVAAIFNDAFDANKPIFDGVPLCADNHPYLKPHAIKGTTSQDNKMTDALSEAAVKTARILMREQASDEGTPLQYEGRVLLVPPSLEYTALEITQAQLKPGTADNDPNTLRGRVTRAIVWDYLTDTNNWFLLDPDAVREGVLFLWRVKPEFKSRDDSDHFELKFVGRMRCSAGVVDWRGIVGSQVA